MRVLVDEFQVDALGCRFVAATCLTCYEYRQVLKEITKMLLFG